MHGAGSIAGRGYVLLAHLADSLAMDGTQIALVVGQDVADLLPERHITVDGEPMAGALVDFGLFAFHNARILHSRDRGPYFYLPKLQSMEEAALWNDVMATAEAALDLPPDCMKATVLIETLATAGQEIDILNPLPAHPANVPVNTVIEDVTPLKMVYHATGVHRHEHEFLMPIVKAAMERHDNLHFEVFASGALARCWNRLGIDPARITIVAPLSWPAYLARTTHENADIALVPLLPGKTNASRADTKRVDITRLQAAAIFSQCPTFARCAVAGELHIDNTVEDWSAAIDQLVNDRECRLAARDATRYSIDRMREQATPTFPGVRLYPAVTQHDVAIL